MKKLKLFFACLLMAVLSIGQVWGAKDDVVYQYGGTALASSNTYTNYSNASIASTDNGSTVTSASWAVTCGSNQSQKLWMGANNNQKAKMILSTGSYDEASGIASAIGVQTSSTYYAALIGRTTFENVYKVTLTYTTPGGTAPSEAWILYSTDNGSTWSVGKKVTTLSTSGTDFEFDETIASARYAFVIHSTNYCQFKAPILTFYEGTTSGGGGSSKTDVTDEQLAWSADDAEVTMEATDNVFPTLTNSLDLEVTYQSTVEAVATIDANGDITLVKAGSTIIKAIYAGSETLNAKTVSYTLTVNPAPLVPIVGAAVDVLTAANFTATGSSYTAFSNVQAANEGHSDAVYLGKTAKNGNNIQINSISSGNAGREIATSASGGTIKRLEVTWGSGNTDSRSVMIYGSHNAYDATETSKTATNLGSITYHTGDVSGYVDIDDSEEAFEYIQITASGAMYVSEMRISWMPAAKYAVNIASVENGALAVKDGDDAITSGDEFVEGKTLNVVATPAEGYKLDGIKVIETGSDPENDVTSTVLAGTTLTVPAYAVTVSATFSENEAPFATLTLSELGDETVYYDDDSKHEGDIVALPLDAASCSKVFRGWDPDENCTTVPTYAPGDDFTLGASASNVLYAVYATPTVDPESEPELAQTLLYDTWTYSGTTTNKSSYRLFGNGSYVESAEFDLSTLAKVKVFGGTYGGQDTYKTGTIGDGTNTWKSIELTGTGNAKEHEFIEGNALSGNGKLYVTSTCGNGTDNGLRISKVEIYAYGTTYGEYSTECMAKVDAPTFPVEQKEYTAAQNITISAVDGATIHYTTDGSIPTSTSATYSEPIALSARGEYVIKAIAVKDGFANSDVAVAHYSINLPFANLADLVAAELADGSEVIVSFADEVITNKGSKYIYLTTEDVNDNPIEVYYGSENVPEAWVVGGKVAATSKRFTWTLFNSTQWELVPVGEFAWATDLAYTAPKTVSSVVVSGEPTKKVYLLGETFDPAGLTVTVNYSDETSEVNPAVGVTFTTDPENGKMALEQTSIKVKATYNTVTSEEWFTVSGLTVNDLETKTIAEFIASEGGRCYLIGTVSNITNTQYGNFDLTDASGVIYVYGCLDTEGASKNFASLDVVEDDYIKVIADVYEYYNNETHEAKNVQFVEELEKPDVPVTSVSVANATVKINKTVQLTANVLPINASNKNVTWSVKEGSEAIAEVNETGLVTGKVEGEAVIVATSVADNTKFGECTVTVTGGINFAAGDFVLVENANELTEGTYVIVAGAGENNVAMKYHAGNSDGNHKGKAAIKEGKYLHYDADFGVYEIKDYVVEEVKQGISFYNENAENYFALPGNSNQLKTSTEQNNNSSWTAAVSEGVTTLTNKALTTRTLRYNINSGSPIFACYTSGQQPIALYKYVTPAAYRVYYNDNVAEEEIEVPAYQSVNGENKVTITTVEPVRDGYLFDGWKDGEANVYEAGVEYTLSADLTLYAQWTTATVSTLSYNPNGGTLIDGETEIADAEVAEGANLTIAANVYEKGDNYVFAGWKLGNDVYQPGDPFVMPANDVEFVAQWDAVEVSDYALVTDLAQLQAGDKIIIVAADYNVAAGSQAATFRNPVTIGKTASKNNLILAGYTTPTEFTLGISDGKFSFNDGDGYMYENGEKSVKVQADPYYWTISIDAEAIATITGTNPLLYNSNSGQERFTTYTSSQKVLQLYRKPGATPDYTRDVTVGNYGTICLPNGGNISGAKLFDLEYYDGANTLYLLEVEGNAMVAGRPYIFLPSVATIEVFYTDEENASAGNYNGLVGSYTTEYITPNDGNYILLNNQYYRVVTDARVGANRAYIHMEDVPNAPSQQQGAPSRRVAMAVNGENAAQGFENIESGDKPMKVMIEGTMYILRGEKVYDATGRLVK